MITAGPLIFVIQFKSWISRIKCQKLIQVPNAFETQFIPKVIHCGPTYNASLIFVFEKVETKFPEWVTFVNSGVVGKDQLMQLAAMINQAGFYKPTQKSSKSATSEMTKSGFWRITDTCSSDVSMERIGTSLFHCLKSILYLCSSR